MILAFSHIIQTTANFFENNSAKTCTTSINSHGITVYNRKHNDKEGKCLVSISHLHIGQGTHFCLYIYFWGTQIFLERKKEIILQYMLFIYMSETI